MTQEIELKALRMRRRAWEALYRMQPAPSVISRLSDAPETITLRVGAAGGLTRGHVPAVCAQLRQRRPAVRLGRTDPLAAETLDELAERSSPVATETASGLLDIWSTDSVQPRVEVYSASGRSS